jgi:hypothetical protein
VASEKVPAPAERHGITIVVGSRRVCSDLHLVSPSDGKCIGQFVGPLILMNRKRILAAVIAITLAGAVFYFYGGSQTPAGQPPLKRLTIENSGDVKSAFNTAKDDVRILLLLSPT